MGRSATWLGAALALGMTLGGCQPLTELPRPPNVGTQGVPEPPAPVLPAPVLPPALAPEPAPEPEAAPAAPAVAREREEPAEAPVVLVEETVAAFEAPAKPRKQKKRKGKED